MRYKITIQSLTDATDHVEVEGDAVIAFVGKVELQEGKIEHGMVFSGNKRVMAEVINSIPPQIAALAKEEMRRANTPAIVTPDGKELPKKN